MKILLITIFLTQQVFGATKFLQGDFWKSNDITKTWTPPPTSSVLLGANATQQITNKDLDGGTASNTSRITLPKASRTTLNSLTRKQGTVVYDTTNNVALYDDGTTLKDFDAGGGGNNLSSDFIVDNIGLSVTIASSALTVTLTQANGSALGSSNPNSGSIGFRSSTTSSGSTNTRSVTSALSIVISNGSTLGLSGLSTIYVYAIDNAGTVELAVSAFAADENDLLTTTAEGGAGAADLSTLIYSNTAITNVPFRLLGRVKASQTSGAWNAIPPVVSLGYYTNYNKVSSSLSDVKIVFAHFAGATPTTVCSTSPCTLTATSPEVTSIIRTSAGNYSINILAGTFPLHQKCFWTFANGLNAFTHAASSTGISILNGVTGADVFGDVMCVGK